MQIDAKSDNEFSYVCPHCGYKKTLEYRGLEIGEGSLISLGLCTNCQRTKTFLSEIEGDIDFAKAIRKIFKLVRLITKK